MEVEVNQFATPTYIIIFFRSEDGKIYEKEWINEKNEWFFLYSFNMFINEGHVDDEKI